jgi:LEA14-like dessication related protein
MVFLRPWATDTIYAGIINFKGIIVFMFNLNASVLRRFIFSSLCLFICSFSMHSQASSLLTVKPPDVMVTKIEFIRLVENDVFLNITFKVKNTNPSHINIKAI